MKTKKSKVELGIVVETPGAKEASVQSGKDGGLLLRRHASCDWGEVCESDWDEDEVAADNYLRLFTVRRLQENAKGCIITDADGKVTMILLDRLDE